MSFDAKFECGRLFLINLLPKSVRKWVSSTFVDFSKSFYPGAETIKINWASLYPLDCLEKQLRGFWVTFFSRYVVWPRYSLDVE